MCVGDEEGCSPPGSCGVDLHDVVVGGGQHQNLLRVAVVEHLSRAEGLEARHGHAPLLLVAAAHRVDAASAADARRVRLVVQRLVQQGQVVVLHAAVCRRQEERQNIKTTARTRREDGSAQIPTN